MNFSKVTGTVHDDKCEECGEALTHENVTEGDFGFYCGQACLEYADELGGPSDASERATERKQMGLTNF